MRVDKALEGGLNLGRGMLDNMLQDLAGKADRDGARAVDAPARRASRGAERPARAGGRAGGDALQRSAAACSRTRAASAPGSCPSRRAPAVLRQIRAQQGYQAVESMPDKGLYPAGARAGARREPAPTRRACCRWCSPCPRSSRQDAEAVQSGYREYQELTLSRRGLKRLYALTLTLTLLLALLSARGARVRALRPAVGAARRAGRGHARGGERRFQPARGGGIARRDRHAHRSRSTA